MRYTDLLFTYLLYLLTLLRAKYVEWANNLTLFSCLVR